MPPDGRTRHGLPVGVQVLAPFLEDGTAIDGARHVERTVGGFRLPPALSS